MNSVKKQWQQVYREIRKQKLNSEKIAHCMYLSLPFFYNEPLHKMVLLYRWSYSDALQINRQINKRVGVKPTSKRLPKNYTKSRMHIYIDDLEYMKEQRLRQRMR